MLRRERAYGPVTIRQGTWNETTTRILEYNGNEVPLDVDPAELSEEELRHRFDTLEQALSELHDRDQGQKRFDQREAVSYAALLTSLAVYNLTLFGDVSTLIAGGSFAITVIGVFSMLASLMYSSLFGKSRDLMCVYDQLYETWTEHIERTGGTIDEGPQSTGE